MLMARFRAVQAMGGGTQYDNDSSDDGDLSDSREDQPIRVLFSAPSPSSPPSHSEAIFPLFPPSTRRRSLSERGVRLQAENESAGAGRQEHQ